MRRLLATSVACLAALAAPLAGCGSGGGSGTPSACLEGSGPYVRALRSAPGRVQLPGGALISECLAPNQPAGELTDVGQSMLAVATKLNAEARAQPGGDANVRLGFLLGAAQRGAESTEGIHAELVRRLAAAARYSPDNRPLPQEFLGAYELGFNAGHGHG